MWLLPYIFSMLAFLGTFFFIRIAGKIARQFYTKSSTVNWDNLKITVVRSAPTVVLGILLLMLRNRFGWIWISPGAVWASLTWDGLHLIFTLYYIGKLRSLRRNPASFFYQVKVEPYDDWADSNLPYIIPVKFWLRGSSVPVLFQPLSFILTFFGSGKTPLGILYGDFRRFLRGDFRYVDVFDDIDGKLDLSEEELWSVPHLAVKDANAYKRQILGFFGGMLGDAVKEGFKRTAKFSDEETGEQNTDDVLKSLEPDDEEPKFSLQAFRSTSKSFLTNRAINTALPVELWEASRRLCKTTPSIVADTWKLYHFQDDVRLRLIMLFTVSDLMQRLLGAIVLRMLAEIGELGSLTGRPDFPFGKTKEQIVLIKNNPDWNKLLRWALKNSESEELEIFRRMLLKPNPDFAATVEKLAPIWQILQDKPPHYVTEQNALDAFSLLTHLRNKTVGHGSIGWKLQLRPAVYLSAFHHFFLAAIEDVSNLDLGIAAYLRTEDDLELVSLMDGLSTGEKAEGSGRVAVLNPVNGELLDLDPYLRFYEGRLLIAEKIFENDAIYVDYKAENIAEPSFIKLEIGESFMNGVAGE